jgi:hypothetical protein
MKLSEVVLFGLVLPEPERLMEPLLREVDKALEDEEIVSAVTAVLRRRWRQSAGRGRAGTPSEVVLRMLALKHLRDWSYDELEREVTGSLVYRRFCRIDAARVPDAKTMVRLGQVVDGVLSRAMRRLVGAETRTPGKIVSVFEPWAQIIRKGKLDRPTEFGAVVKVQEAEGGIVTHIAVDDARADALLLVQPGSRTNGSAGSNEAARGGQAARPAYPG